MTTFDGDRRPLADRFWEKVDVRGLFDCWEWTGYRKRQGYGVIWSGGLDGRSTTCSRVSWEINRGPIPDGLHVLHHCDNPPCVNPAHLFLGTNADNVRDMVAKGRAAGSRMTHCKRGHEFTPENTNWFKTMRTCRTCKADAQRQRRLARIAA